MYLTGSQGLEVLAFAAELLHSWPGNNDTMTQHLMALSLCRPSCVFIDSLSSKRIKEQRAGYGERMFFLTSDGNSTRDSISHQFVSSEWLATGWLI